MKGLKSLIKGKGGSTLSRKLNLNLRKRRDLILTTQILTQRKSTAERATMENLQINLILKKGKREVRVKWTKRERVIWTVMSLSLTKSTQKPRNSKRNRIQLKIDFHR